MNFLRAFLNCLTPFVLCLSSTVFANGIDESPWQFDIAPYMWAMNMNGRVQNGPLTTHISQSFEDIMKHFDGGGMLWLSAHKGPFGLFVNGLYSVLSDHGDIRRIDASMKTKFGIFSGGVSYILFKSQLENQLEGCNQFQVEPYLGGRYTFNNVKLKLDQFAFKSDHSWTDPILGLRLRYDLNPQWNVQLSGDVGGTNRSTHYSYNVIGLVGYHPCLPRLHNLTFYAGYRNLYQVYETGSGLRFFRWNMRLFGPMLGVNFTV